MAVYNNYGFSQIKIFLATLLGKALYYYQRVLRETVKAGVDWMLGLSAEFVGSEAKNLK